MDILPQVKNGRTYVPLSTITNLLGATVKWENPNVVINYKDQVLSLMIGKTEGIQNGQEIRLDEVPYVDKGRTMVPIRFISKAFGLDIDYKDNKVSIDFPKLKINEVSIDAIQSEYWMTMGSVISESKNNNCMSSIYDVISKGKGKEIEEPSFYGRHANLDVPKAYYLEKAYYFTDSSNKRVKEYKIYSELSFGMSTGVYIVNDTTNSKWYSFSEEEYYYVIDLQNIGKWDVISNTVL